MRTPVIDLAAMSDLYVSPLYSEVERLTAEVSKLRDQRTALMTALKIIEANCLVWQSGESEMSAGDFLALIQSSADEAMPPKARIAS